ncbi:hypothetical protein [Hafnia alvei]|uniref:hypothetical protein n=1 Tax=Hafnia alvei TaxID=569 RepID=UPI001040817B|nr:hypothetical protein [Hafnia alvei]QBJ35011.1 hypothetical protein EYZ02_19935 [Hafnia alvei]
MTKGKVNFLSEQHPVKRWPLSSGKRVRAAQGDSTGMLAGVYPALIGSKIKELKAVRDCRS